MERSNGSALPELETKHFLATQPPPIAPHQPRFEPIDAESGQQRSERVRWLQPEGEDLGYRGRPANKQEGGAKQQTDLLILGIDIDPTR